MPEWFLKLGFMGWPLLACSIIVITLWLERVVFFIRTSKQTDETYTRLSHTMSENKHQPKMLRDELTGIHLNMLQKPTYAGIKLLRIIGTISPMLGLLGTVLGIISAFQVIASHQGPISPNMIADGLWEAMLTTAVGLFIALPALLSAHFFRHLGEMRLGSLCSRLNQQSLEIELAKNVKLKPAQSKTQPHNPAPH